MRGGRNEEEKIEEKQEHSTATINSVLSFLLNLVKSTVHWLDNVRFLDKR